MVVQNIHFKKTKKLAQRGNGSQNCYWSDCSFKNKEVRWAPQTELMAYSSALYCFDTLGLGYSCFLHFHKF